MPIFRINKNKDYTIMSNYHLKDKRISLKAKGLLSQMLSLPDDWEYSKKGLTLINREGELAIKGALDELKEHKYLIVTKTQGEDGKFEYIYDIFEKPQKPDSGKPGVENPGLENHPLNKYTNNKILNNKKLNNKYTNNKKENNKKEKYGTYGRVLLTIDEYLKLVNEFGEDFIKNQIELLDEYVESNDNKNKYKNFNLVLRKSIRENWFNKKPTKQSFLDIMKEERNKCDDN